MRRKIIWAEYSYNKTVYNFQDQNWNTGDFTFYLSKQMKIRSKNSKAEDLLKYCKRGINFKGFLSKKDKKKEEQEQKHNQETKNIRNRGNTRSNNSNQNPESQIPAEETDFNQFLYDCRKPLGSRSNQRNGCKQHNQRRKGGNQR